MNKIFFVYGETKAEVVDEVERICNEKGYTLIVAMAVPQLDDSGYITLVEVEE